MKAAIFRNANCRNSVYARSSINRFRVPDEFVFWTVEFADYKPIFYESDVLSGKPWADPKTDDKNFFPKWNQLDGKVSRISHCGEYKIVQDYPQNPCGRTGIIGRGLLGRWGPNHAADPIVTRWKRDNTGKILTDDQSGSKILQMVAIERLDTKEWAIPGGMVDPGEKVSETVKREFMEEALSSTADLSKSLTEFFNNGTEVYSGYVDDPRNTDNAWMETVAYNFHDDSGAIVGDINLCAGDDAGKVKWMDLNRNVVLYASHKNIVEIVVTQLNAFW
ncbi:ADP-ribose pyrophosphatase, mitochondrial-like [Bradysia coprophila]|uniref:ADP-ribose pyrophosphatase, mitochondrial-like n=1 Tax=Bradysia coprophila TaxID=38358 RepID=UPI00187DA781|nr:ADP-ribose pyrophosphatase, mitochondrial-like [Bradysia coprophila]